MKYISKNPEETQKIAEDFIASLKTSSKATVIAFEGDLGSGKTTFSQFVGQLLGVEDAMQSPTFLIQKVYELQDQKWKHLIHIDAYRLDKDNESLHLGWQETINNPENIVLIEWADRVKNILPESAIHIVLRHGEADSPEEKSGEVREIEINPA